MCTRNGETYVGEQIESILNQAPAPAEIVVSDDDSRDGTLGVVSATVNARRAGRGGPVLRTLVNTKPLGVTANFGQAVAACTCELIALSDQDDVWHAGRLERIAAEFERRPQLLALGSDARLVDGDGHPLGRSLSGSLQLSRRERSRLARGDVFRALMGRNLFTGATMVVRRDLLRHALPFPLSWVHDEWLAVVASAVGEVAMLADELIDYRQHSYNEIGAPRPTLAHKVSRLGAPRTERNERLVARARDLVERLDILDVSDEVRSIARAKLRHEEVRRSLPRARLARLPGVVREYVARGYRDYGRGARDALRDLVQPAA
jgi:glycosyltransferase involved in cell wall biosynthesis